MSRRRPVSVLSALGVSDEDEHLYQQVLPLSGTPLAGVAAALGVPVERVSEPLSGLLAVRERPPEGPPHSGRGGGRDRA